MIILVRNNRPSTVNITNNQNSKNNSNNIIHNELTDYDVKKIGYKSKYESISDSNIIQEAKANNNKVNNKNKNKDLNNNPNNKNKEDMVYNMVYNNNNNNEFNNSEIFNESLQGFSKFVKIDQT